MVDRVERLQILQRQRRLRTARKLLIVACVAAATVQVFRGHRAAEPQYPPATSAVATSTAFADEWSQQLRELDECRQSLFRSRIKAMLDNCDVPGSAAWRSDSRALERAVAQDVQIASLPLELISAQPLARRWSEANEYVQLLVRDRLDANTINVAGLETRIPGRPAAEWLVTLRRSRPMGEWRYFEVKPKPVPSES